MWYRVFPDLWLVKTYNISNKLRALTEPTKDINTFYHLLSISFHKESTFSHPKCK